MEQNQTALLVAPTWNEIEAVTEKVRAALKTSGRLTGEESAIQVFDSLSWTEAQKLDARQYLPGMAIRFHHRYGGFNKGESVSVMAVGDDALTVQRADGSEKLFSLCTGIACDVGEQRTLKIAAGDKLLLQANWQKKFVNGELVEVKTIQGDALVLADGRVIPKSYRTFTHGYAVTSHAAQGKTVDEVLVVASTRSLPAVSQQQFYVSISRGRVSCQVFTDDVERLRSHVTHSSERLAAIEALPHRRNFIRNILRQGHRFLTRFRERLARQQTISSRNRTSRHEDQHQSIRSISV